MSHARVALRQLLDYVGGVVLRIFVDKDNLKVGIILL